LLAFRNPLIKDVMSKVHMYTFLIGIFSSVSTVGLLLFAVYLSRNWLVERLKASIKYEYDVRLEKHKSDFSRRELSYEEIIHALYDMTRYFRVHKEDYGQGTGLSDEREQELLQKYIAASSSLNKATDIGAFYVSDEASTILNNLRKRDQLDYYNEPKFEFYEQEYKEHQIALDKLMKVAKKELNIS